MDFHPLANLFPLMEGAEFAALVEDIRIHGLLEPIVMLDGMILDGRNRWRACEAAGVATRTTVPYTGDDPVAFVVSLNLHRRHLSDVQRAMIARDLANMRQGTRTDLEPSTNSYYVSLQDAADMLNVGRNTVAVAGRILDQGAPELIEAVRGGHASARAAEAVSTLPKEEQVQAVAGGREGIAKAAKEVHNHRALSTGEYEWYTPEKYIEIARAFLGTIDLDPASSKQAQKTVKAGTFFNETDNGLLREWFGRVWLNPPYKQPDIQLFLEKAAAEYTAGRVSEVIILTHNYTDTEWFHIGAFVASAICFTRGRIKFERFDGVTGSPTQGQAFFYLGRRHAEFARAFADVGFVVSPI